MILHQGILSKQQRNIPYGVIQNIFVHQRLVDRIFGLASLSIENASQGGGNQNSNNTKAFGITISNQQTKKRGELEMPGFNGNKISIPGLTKQNAEALRELILQKMKDNPVEDNQSGL
jgi:membrane protein YdbS with pleckstrin-like domain